MLLIKSITVMSRAKIPPGEWIRGRFCCPVTGCEWDCKDRTSYSRHYAGHHALSYKFICDKCTAVHSRRDLAVEHARKCRRSRAANMKRRGRKPRFANDRQVRVAFPADEEEAVQEMEAQVEELEREKQQILADKNQLQVEMEQLQEKHEVEMKQLQEKYEVEKKAKEELRGHVGRLEAKIKEMEAHEPGMDVDKEPTREEEEDNNSLKLVWEGEDEEMLEEEMDEVPEEEVDDQGGDQQPVLLPSPPGQLLLRRSERRSRATLLREEQEEYEAKLLVTDDARHGLVVVDITGKGRGVEASRPFSKGDFVVEYAGEVMDAGSGHAMEATYSMDMTKGSYSYYFPFNSKNFCLDATEESGRYGRLLNHSRKHPTCVPKVVEVAGTPRLIFLAKHNIKAGQEITFDYGDRSKKSLAHFPWLAL